MSLNLGLSVSNSGQLLLDNASQVSANRTAAGIKRSLGKGRSGLQADPSFLGLASQTLGQGNRPRSETVQFFGRGRRPRRPDELPAPPRISIPYFILTNVNAAKDDNFILGLANPEEQSSGSVNFTEIDKEINFATDVGLTYFFLGRTSSVDRFQTRKAGRQWAEQFVPDIVGYEPVLEVSRLPFKLRPQRTYPVRLRNVKQNFNGNFGQWYAGYTGNREVVTGFWSPPDGQDEILEITWPKRFGNQPG
jgi:hypothetical protein